MDVARADGEILKMFCVCSGEVVIESLLKGLGQRDDSMSAAFAIMNRDGALAEIEVFDAEAKGFHDSQAGAIHELGGEFPRAFQTGDDGADLRAGHYDGRAALATTGSDVDESEFRDAENVFHEERHGIEGLFLCGRGDVSFEC